MVIKIGERVSQIAVVLALCPVLFWSGCGSAASTTNGNTDHMDITLEIDGLTDGTASMGGIFGDQVYFVQSAESNGDGIFEFKRDSAIEQGLYFVNFPNETTSIQFLLTGDQVFTLKTTMQDPVGDMVVEGSLDNELFYQNQMYEREYQQKYQPLRQQAAQYAEGSPEREEINQQLLALVDARRQHIMAYGKEYPNTFFTTFKISGQNPRLREPKLPNGEIDQKKQTYMYWNDFWTMYDFSDSRLLRTPVLQNKLKSFFDLMPQNADTIIKYADHITRQSMQNDSVFEFVANWIGVKYKEPFFMGSDAVYVHMVQNFFTDELATWSEKHELDRLRLDADIRDQSLPGRTAKDIEVFGLNGEKISLYDINADFIVLYIYTPECDNCRKETPLVRDFYREWKPRGVEVFALCTAEDEEVWKNYVRENNLNWVNGIDPDGKSRYTFKYHIDVTPEIYVMDKNFKIIGKDLKAFQIPTILERNM